MRTVREESLALMDALGMTTIFGNPGSTELPMFRDLPDHFRYVLGLQESVVMGMADGYAQATRRAALINLHSAAGVGHALGNLFTAFRNQTPLVVTAGQQARSILPYEPFLYAERATEFPRPYVKWAVEPARAEDVPGALMRAWHVAMQPPCGPVFVSIPVDDWDRPCPPVTISRASQRMMGDPDLLTETAQALAAARRPVFVVGAGVALNNAWEEVTALAERHQAGVWVAPLAARCGFPEDHALFQGFLSAFRDSIVNSLAGADLVLVLGAPAFTYHAEGDGPHLPEGARLIQIGDDPAMAARLPEGLGITSCVKAATQALLAGPQPAPRIAPALLVRAAPLAGEPFTDAVLMQRLAALRPRDSIIVEEAASSRGAMHDHLPIFDQDGFYTCASGGLGHGLSAAMGVALGQQDRRVIALLGDGASMYAIQGLWSAAQLNLPMIFVIVNNGRYEALHVFGRHFGLQRLHGTQLPDLDFVSMAAGQGVKGVRVTTAEAFDEAFAKALAQSEPVLIEAVVV